MQLYNTLSRTKEDITAMDGKTVDLYTCGPTVYDYPHVGNMRAYVLEDLLKRTVEYFGLGVKHVMNITDVGHLVSDEDEGEDKMEKGSRREGKSVWEIAQMYTDAFFADTDKLNVIRPEVVCKATDHIPEQIAMVNALTAKGFTYSIGDGIYFDTSKLSDYGKLAKLDVKGLEAGKRVEMAEGKKNATDFALWKFSPKSEQRQMEWIFSGPRANTLITEDIRPTLTAEEEETRGFPGWHIECSAMAMKYLGESFDLHCGGVDHIAVHHTNEIAQAEAATGKPFVRHWMHIEHLQIEGKKMSKSLGNFYTVSSLEEKGFTPRAIRFLYLSAHYRQQQNFTIKALEQATASLEGIDQFVREITSVIASEAKQSPDTYDGDGKLTTAMKSFDEALSDDLNVPQALSVLFDFIRETNPALVQGDVSKAQANTILEWLRKIDAVLGVLRFDFDDALPEEVSRLVAEREQARANKDFAASDRLRGEIEKLGYMVKDTLGGQKVLRN